MHLSGTDSRAAAPRPFATEPTVGSAGPVAPPTHAVLIINPRSGGGKAEHYGLTQECRTRGIEPVVLGRGDDLVGIARGVISGGSDAIGVAGGDGSQALVAGVASEHDVAYVCVPAGTRNHFAFDVGIQRADVVGALDAFAHGEERRIDLACVNDRVFVNNASLGVYANIVQSDDYRDAKLETVTRTLPELLPPRGAPFDFAFDAPDGTRWQGPQLLLVSNNPYRMPRPGVQGTRRGIDDGVLGVIALRVVSPSEVLAVIAAETTGAVRPRPGRLDFTTPALVVEGGGPVDVALDGEACALDPPLRFESLRAALRLRVLPPTRAPLGSRSR
jgi:diacylglycerol kinase family enzyme